MCIRDSSKAVWAWVTSRIPPAAAFEGKASYLVQVTHVAMGVLALMLAAARLLELRVAGPLGRLGGTIAGTAMLLIAFVLMFYREANVVVSDAPPPDTITTAPAVRR